MKRYATVLLWLFLTFPALAQSVKLPAEIRGDPGAFIKVPAETADKEVRWYSPDKGLQVFPVELLKDTKTAVVIGNTPGRYRLVAWTAKGDVPSDPAICTIIIGNAPVPPDPGPKPPDPPDPGPTPTPSEGKWVVIAWETEDTMSQGEANVINSTVVRRYLREKLKKPSGGLPDGEFIMWDKDADPTGYPAEWKDRWTKASAKAKSSGKPYLMISNGKSLWEGPMPDSVDKTMELLKKQLDAPTKHLSPEGKN